MKKGLKPAYNPDVFLQVLGFKCRPDEEGIETEEPIGTPGGNSKVSNADLMKKGLKPEHYRVFDEISYHGFKCRPDEEGIETPDVWSTTDSELCFKCRPDEEGIET